MALVAFQQRFFTPERLEAFTRECVAEMNRLRPTGAQRAVAPRELAALNARSTADSRTAAERVQKPGVETGAAADRAAAHCTGGGDRSNPAEPVPPALHPHMAESLRAENHPTRTGPRPRRDLEQRALPGENDGSVSMKPVALDASQACYRWSGISGRCRQPRAIGLAQDSGSKGGCGGGILDPRPLGYGLDLTAPTQGNPSTHKPIFIDSPFDGGRQLRPTRNRARLSRICHQDSWHR